MDADFCVMTQDLDIDMVIAKGQVMVEKGVPVVKGNFEA